MICPPKAYVKDNSGQYVHTRRFCHGTLAVAVSSANIRLLIGPEGDRCLLTTSMVLKIPCSIERSATSIPEHSTKPHHKMRFLPLVYLY